MCLWAGYFTGKNLPEPVLTEIPKIKIDPSQEPDIRLQTVSGNLYLYTTANVLRRANAALVMLGFGVGETVTWMFPYDEFHWVVKGKAEMTYSLAGTGHTERKKATIQEGDIYLIPRGARITWKVGPDGPVRLVGIIMPASADSARRPEKIHKLK